MYKVIITFLAVITLSACKSTPYVEKTQYVLTASNTHETFTPIDSSLGITTTIARDLYQNNEFLYQLKGNQIQHDYYHIFASSPAQQITSNTARWFEQSGLFTHVLSTGLALNATYTLKSKLITLDADYRNPTTANARIEIEYILTDKHKKIILDRRYMATPRLSEKSAQGLVKAWNKGLTTVLSDLTHDMAAILAPNQLSKTKQPRPHTTHKSSQANHFMRLEDNDTLDAQALSHAEPNAQALLRLE